MTDDLKQTSARGAAWNLLQNLISRLLGLVVVAILSRLLDKSAFGGVALALAITTFAELLVNQGYGEFVTQTRDPTPRHLDTAFWFNASLGAVFTALIAIFASPLATALGDASATPVIRWCSLSLLIRSLGLVPAGMLVRELRFKSLSMRGMVASVVGGIVGIVAAFAGLGVYSLVLQLLVGDLAATAILWGAVAWRPGRQLSRDALAELTAFGTPLIGAALLGFVSRRLDSAIVGSVLGLSLLGVYSLAQRVFQIALQVLNKSSVEVVFSALSRLADTTDRRQQAFLRVIELTAVLCFPTYVGLAIVAEPVTLSLLGARWGESVPVLVYFALSGVPFSLSLIHMAALKSAARTRALFTINLTLLIIYVPSIVLLVPYGAAPAAAASLISCALVIPVELWIIRTALGTNVAEYLKALVGPSLATIVMAAATYPLERATDQLLAPVHLVVVAGTGAVVYVIALRVLAPTSFKRCIGLARQTFRRGKAAPAS